jgi:IS30 family transposase
MRVRLAIVAARARVGVVGDAEHNYSFPLSRRARGWALLETPNTIIHSHRRGARAGGRLGGRPGQRRARHRGYLVTLVERATRFTLIGHVARKTAEAVGDEVIRLLAPHKARAHTVTFDNGNGREFAGHEVIAAEMTCECFFARPYHAWERGLNENTNGLIRQYFPKTRDVRDVGHEELTWVMNRLNGRPRKTLGFRRPAEVFAQAT